MLDKRRVAVEDAMEAARSRALASSAQRRLELEDALTAAGDLTKEAANRLTAVVYEARQNGVSWRAIGLCLGMSGQAAQQRWGERVVDSPGTLLPF